MIPLKSVTVFASLPGQGWNLDRGYDARSSEDLILWPDVKDSVDADNPVEATVMAFGSPHAVKLYPRKDNPSVGYVLTEELG